MVYRWHAPSTESDKSIVVGTHVRTGFHAYVALQYEESPNNSKMATLPRVARYFVTYWALSFVAFCMLLEKALPQTKHGNF